MAESNGLPRRAHILRTRAGRVTYWERDGMPSTLSIEAARRTWRKPHAHAPRRFSVLRTEVRALGLWHQVNGGPPERETALAPQATQDRGDLLFSAVPCRTGLWEPATPRDLSRANHNRLGEFQPLSPDLRGVPCTRSRELDRRAMNSARDRYPPRFRNRSSPRRSLPARARSEESER
jgi:hypothetical protein